MAAVCVVFFFRPPRARPVPARVVPGDAVVTVDGLRGTVREVDGTFALVDAGSGRAAWVQCSELESDPSSSDAAGALPGEVDVDQRVAPAPAASPASLPDAGGTLPRLGEGIFVARRTVLWGWLVVVLACMPLAGTAEKSFSQGGFLIKDGEAIRVIEEVRDNFQMPVSQMVVIVPGGIDETRERVDEMLPQLYEVPHVLLVGEPRASTDGQRVATTIYFDDTDDNIIDSYQPLVDVWQAAGYDEGLQVAGTPAVYADTTAQTKKDLAKAEMIGAPLALLVLLFVFGSVVAAIVPLVIGIASVIVTLALLHLLSIPLGLSIFVMNIASMLGLGLGIDYSLLGVSRFREELAAGRSVRDATVTTIATSGRAATISGVAVVAGVAALAAIPLPVMFAIAVGGMVVVCVSVLASLTLLPAILATLGHGIERWRVRRVELTADPTASGWYRLAHAVMRRPGISIFGGVAVLVLLASPTLGAHLDVPHDDVIPDDAPSALARQTLEREFDERISLPVILIIDSADEAVVEEVTMAALGVDHLVRSEVVKVDTVRDRTLVNVFGDAQVGTGGAVSRQAARDVRALDFPVDVTVSGQGAGEIEFLEVIKHNMPHTLVLMFTSTLIILTVAFRSLTLPIKAIILDTLSILASLGLVVAVFQDGVGMELLGAEPLGYTEATIPIILFCLLFGLSMDYEVFMLAKVTELYQSGLDDREATARGVAATAPLVTGAALILIVVGIAFATTELVLVKQIGFGMAVALALDATIVRVLLLPATMRWLGPANWWLPVPLQRRIPRMEWAH